jgi:uncharacterized protein (TIGR00725 family)
MSPRPFQVSLVGPSEAPPETLATAEALGAALARRGVTLITGGRGGVMEAASRGAAQAGGLCIGILPGRSHAQANPYCGVVIPTGIGDARNAVTALAGDLVIAIGGAAGTLSEISLAWIHGRPILGLTGHGGWTDALAGGPVDHRARDPVVRCDDLDSLLGALDRAIEAHNPRQDD